MTGRMGGPSDAVDGSSVVAQSGHGDTGDPHVQYYDLACRRRHGVFHYNHARRFRVYISPVYCTVEPFYRGHLQTNLYEAVPKQPTHVPPWIPWRRLPGSWGPACSRRVSAEGAAWGPRTGWWSAPGS